MTEEVTHHLPLEDRYAARKARMVPFAGYLMPMQFEGIKDEHHAVRNNVGLFDVSHMGEFEFTGPDAVRTVDRLVTNDVSQLKDGQALYTTMCYESGGIVDDLLVYRLAGDHVLACVNATRRSVDAAHVRENLTGDTRFEDTSDDYAQLAIQGPNAAQLVGSIADDGVDDLPYYHARYDRIAGAHVLVSRTGYTGEDGFELYIRAQDAGRVYDAVVAAGEPMDLMHCGLGARDTLRLEAKMLLYGNDMDLHTDPFEAGLSWVVKLDKESIFVGREALIDKKSRGPSRRMRGFVLRERGVLRPGYPLFAGDVGVGELTSGTYSPTLECSIGLGYVSVEHANESHLDVEVRGKRIQVELTKKPFYKRKD